MQQALNTVKIQKQQEIERLQMKCEDLEMQIHNSGQADPSDKTNAVLDQLDGRLVLRNTEQARGIINDLKGIVKGDIMAKSM